ncbi:alpha-lytic protease prodomain-containing protein [Catellatospora sp. KI3]|uniref:alpha-lytic protease prodomain-containing protein n=1 Tax=Catellatospora sp. KI3 TaxID=3041620 RepID=UPI002482A2F8|nr:alpha-lytic protease prodomain-containing protein [Catellatospora sp. KI3]MDI1464752.1 alpha-lytic protease prodomain-containing protein [Catellatospora sp. KI3]
MTDRKWIAALAATVAASVALVVTPAAVASTGQPAATPVAADRGMVSELARTLRISPEQALARLGRESAFARTEDGLRRALGTGFGGAYLNDDASVLTVAVTGEAAAARVRAAGAKPVLVARSESGLREAAARLDRRAAQAPAQVPGWYPDVRGNTVAVLYRAGALEAARAWVAASGLDAATVRFEASTEQPRPLIDVVGGNAYYIGSGTRCSVGFAVTGGFVTAGHCGTSGATTTQPSGSFAGSSFPGNDYAWVRVAAGNTPRAQVNRYPGTVAVAGSQAVGVGASVCRSGSTTGWHCGTVSALNSSVTYSQGTVTGLIRTDVCAEPGDSGGSLIAGDQAQGVTSGGSGNCSSGGTTYFQSVNEILQTYGLTLTVSGGTPPTSPGPSTSPGNPGGCGGLPGWSATTAYAPGASVAYQSRRYEATWWSTGAEPSAPGSWAVWADRGAC